MLSLTITLGWKLFFLYLILSFIGIVYIFIKGCKNAEEASLKEKEDTCFQENDLVDEFSPEHIQVENTYNRLFLKNKLEKIEKERQQKDVDLDYSREEGR